MYWKCSNNIVYKIINIFVKLKYYQWTIRDEIRKQLIENGKQKDIIPYTGRNKENEKGNAMKASRIFPRHKLKSK